MASTSAADTTVACEDKNASGSLLRVDDYFASELDRRIFEVSLSAQYLYDRDWRDAMLNVALVYDCGWDATARELEHLDKTSNAPTAPVLAPMPRDYPLAELQSQLVEQAFYFAGPDDHDQSIMRTATQTDNVANDKNAVEQKKD